jgi:hypothetical protein
MIKQLAVEGLQLVENSVTHNLEIGFRCRYLNAIDSVFIDHSKKPNLSARLLIGLSAINKVISLWNVATGNDSTPLRCFDIVNKHKILSPDAANFELKRLWSHCDNLLWENDGDTGSLMVGFGAIQLAREAVFGPITCSKVTSSSTDLDIEPSENDPSFFAAAAFAGGAPWEEEANKIKRLEFWIWWLNETLQIAKGEYV